MLHTSVSLSLNYQQVKGGDSSQQTVNRSFPVRLQTTATDLHAVKSFLGIPATLKGCGLRSHPASMETVVAVGTVVAR